MAKTPSEIAGKVQEVYTLVSKSATPISTLIEQSTLLKGTDDWLPSEAERVGGEVMGLLIRHGWDHSNGRG